MKRKIQITVMLVTIMMFGVSDVRAESIVFTESGTILEGEVWDWVSIYNDDTVVDMEGGLADIISTHDESTLNMFGGEAEVSVWDYSSANISGGEISAGWAHHHGTLNFSDDAIGDYLGVDDFGTINMSGGSIGRVIGRDDGIANLYIGSISSYIAAHDSSIVNIFGYDLYKSDSGGAYGDGIVYGLWTDGTPFNIALRDDEFGPTFPNIYLHEIPEPGTLILLGLGSLVLRKKLVA